MELITFRGLQVRVNGMAIIQGVLCWGSGAGEPMEGYTNTASQVGCPQNGVPRRGL